MYVLIGKKKGWDLNSENILNYSKLSVLILRLELIL